MVVVHDMAREAPRTLHSLSPDYQRDIDAADYEVIVVDNGSDPPVNEEDVKAFGEGFHLIRVDPAPPSPAHAVNVGLEAARGDVVGLMIDGARMVTPGFVHFGLKGAGLFPRSVVVSLGWYLGYDLQRWAIQCGYDQHEEDRLLASINWQDDGYRLFEISALDEPSWSAGFGSISESNGLFLGRASWDLLGGADERFDLPGGGFLNLDITRRALELPDTELVVLLGEGTFHQMHGGTATNAEPDRFEDSVARWRSQYEAIRGQEFEPVRRVKRTFLGSLPPRARVQLARSIAHPGGGQGMDQSFNPRLMSFLREEHDPDPVAASLVQLAKLEIQKRRLPAAAAVARIARAYAPRDPGPQDLLATTGGALMGGAPPTNTATAIAYHLSRAKAFRAVGELQKAKDEYGEALKLGDAPEAHVGLAELKMPGDGYLHWLSWFHATLAPATYLEIGVSAGRSLSLARPPTIAVGVDPEPRIAHGFSTETHIYTLTSDQFFKDDKLPGLLGDRPLDLVFIDGLHVFEQALTDFMNAEAHCGQHSVILFHDTIPLNERTQRREPVTGFHTGDVWRTIVCLKRFRPDLDIVTIATPWSGLTMITNLDPQSRELRNRYDEALASCKESYKAFRPQFKSVLNVVPNKRKPIARILAALPKREGLADSVGINA